MHQNNQAVVNEQGTKDIPVIRRGLALHVNECPIKMECGMERRMQMLLMTAAIADITRASNAAGMKPLQCFALDNLP